MPVFGTRVLTEQAAEFFLGRVLLSGQFADLLAQRVELLLAMLLMGVCFLDRLLTRLLLGQFIALVGQLFETLADLLVQEHEGRRRFAAQPFQGLGRQQAGEGLQFFVEAFAVVGQLALLVDQ
mgnify:CR=1 FL=1